MSLQNHLDRAVIAIETASKSITLDATQTIFSIKNNLEVVSKLDLRPNVIIKEILKDENFAVISEKDGKDQTIKDNSAWVIKPLDGKANLSNNLPIAGVSIALVIKNEPVLGVIKNIFTRDLYTCIKGEGIYKNRVKLPKSVGMSTNTLVTTGFPQDKDLHAKHCDVLKEVIECYGDFRRSGSVIIDITFLLEGKTNGICEILNPWDYAAGIVFCNELGFKTNIKNIFENERLIKEDYFIAGKEEVFNKLMSFV